MASSNSISSDPQRCSTSSSTARKRKSFSDQSKRNFTYQNQDRNSGSLAVDGVLRNEYDSTLLDAQITLIDTSNPATIPITTTTTTFATINSNPSSSSGVPKTVEDVWREIKSGNTKELKKESIDNLETLEDFLARAEALGDIDVKVPQSERLSGGMLAFDPMPLSPLQSLDKVEGTIVGYGNGTDVFGTGGGGGRLKRGRLGLEPLDKAAQQRQKRMIKNRESAARSRERKQAYQAELESLAVKLEEENDQLLKEKVERTKERYKQLMENIIPVVEKQRQPARVLRRVCSLEW